MDRLPFPFVLACLLFSGIVFYNSCKLWFKTDGYYQDIYKALLANRLFIHSENSFSREWKIKALDTVQKVFSLFGLVAVVVADVVVVAPWIN